MIGLIRSGKKLLNCVQYQHSQTIYILIYWLVRMTFIISVGELYKILYYYVRL